MLLIASLRIDLLPLFCCLTYPAEFPLEASTFKRHLDSFGKRFLRQFPAGSFVWKLEFQKRGAAHFHLIVYGVSLDEMRKWLALAWYETVGSQDAGHLLAGVRSERLNSRRAVMSYLGGYVSKADQTRPGECFGRYWGIVGRQNLPFCESRSMELDPKVGVKVNRTARRFIAAMGRARRLNMVAKVCKKSFGEASDLMMRQEARPYVEHFGRRIPRKIRVREGAPTRNVLCNADKWMEYVIWEQKQKVL